MSDDINSNKPEKKIFMVDSILPFFETVRKMTMSSSLGGILGVMIYIIWGEKYNLEWEQCLFIGFCIGVLLSGIFNAAVDKVLNPLTRTLRFYYSLAEVKFLGKLGAIKDPFIVDTMLEMLSLTRYSKTPLPSIKELKEDAEKKKIEENNFKLNDDELKAKRLSELRKLKTHLNTELTSVRTLLSVAYENISNLLPNSTKISPYNSEANDHTLGKFELNDTRLLKLKDTEILLVSRIDIINKSIQNMMDNFEIAAEGALDVLETSKEIRDQNESFLVNSFIKSIDEKYELNINTSTFIHDLLGKTSTKIEHGEPISELERILIEELPTRLKINKGSFDDYETRTLIESIYDLRKKISHKMRIN